MPVVLPQQLHQQPIFNVGPLLQLDQLVVLVAALCPETTPADKVRAAMELCAEAAVQLPNYDAICAKRKASESATP